MLDQDQANQLGSPVGMLLAEGFGLKEERFGGVWPRGGSVVGRRRDRSIVAAAELEEVIDGSLRQAKTPSQGRSRQTALVGTKHGLTERQWDGAWHGRRLPKDTNDAKRTRKR